MSDELPAHERFRRSYHGPREPYRPRHRIVEPRTTEEQAAYEKRHAPRPGCAHLFAASGDGNSLICRRCFGFKPVEQELP